MRGKTEATKARMAQIVAAIENAGEPVSTREISEIVEMGVRTVKDCLLYLETEGKIERIPSGRRKGHLYQIPGGNWIEKADIAPGAILEEEIRRTKKKAKPGTPVFYIDEDGDRRRTTVERAYPYHCRLENGHSYTWAQMVLYYRGRQRGKSIR